MSAGKCEGAAPRLTAGQTNPPPHRGGGLRAERAGLRPDPGVYQSPPRGCALPRPFSRCYFMGSI